MGNKNFLVKSHDVLKGLTRELDSNTGLTLCRLETLKNINIELGYVAEDVNNTDLADKSAVLITFRDIAHKIMLLSELLRYTVEDLEGNFEQTQLIKDSYFDLIVGGEIRVKQ